MRAWPVVAAGAALGGIAPIITAGQSPRQQVEAKVHELARAVGSRDYQTICRDVLAPELATRLSLYGAPCAHTLRIALRRVHDPVVSVGKVTVRADRAWAITLTVARGERARLAAIELLDTAGGWRITSLNAPLNRSALG